MIFSGPSRNMLLPTAVMASWYYSPAQVFLILSFLTPSWAPTPTKLSSSKSLSQALMKVSRLMYIHGVVGFVVVVCFIKLSYGTENVGSMILSFIIFMEIPPKMLLHMHVSLSCLPFPSLLASLLQDVCTHYRIRVCVCVYNFVCLLILFPFPIKLEGTSVFLVLDF